MLLLSFIFGYSAVELSCSTTIRNIHSNSNGEETSSMAREVFVLMDSSAVKYDDIIVKNAYGHLLYRRANGKNQKWKTVKIKQSQFVIDFEDGQFIVGSLSHSLTEIIPATSTISSKTVSCENYDHCAPELGSVGCAALPPIF